MENNILSNLPPPLLYEYSDLNNYLNFSNYII